VALAIDSADSSASNVPRPRAPESRPQDEAIEAFRTAVEKDPGNAYAQNNLGYALIGAAVLRRGAVPEEAVRLKPGVGIFQNNLGMAIRAHRTQDQAIGAYRSAVRAAARMRRNVISAVSAGASMTIRSGDRGRLGGESRQSRPAPNRIEHGFCALA